MREAGSLHLADLLAAHARAPPDLVFPTVSAPRTPRPEPNQSLVSSPAQQCVEL